ncbi:VOC family protein [Kitasatospora sp. NPDC087314]|uniref:VOC family protein n=1 Tax=Kitasatospora sp. NPDC087314 TaxID=3364068 RepID=UPI00381EE921
MDALYPRLLVTRFAACFDFYRAVLPPLTGATLVKGTPDGPYANWDVDEQAVLVLYDRASMAATLGTTDLPDRPGAPVRDAAMLVFRVSAVDDALTLCLHHGGTLVVGPTDRPEWGPNLRTAHLRDPDGHLIELQSY